MNYKEMNIKQLEDEKQEQINRNIALYNLIPTAKKYDPRNVRAELIINAWREGVKLIRELGAELAQRNI